MVINMDTTYRPEWRQILILEREMIDVKRNNFLTIFLYRIIVFISMLLFSLFLFLLLTP